MLITLSKQKYSENWKGKSSITEPTWIISSESDDSPTADGHANRVPTLRVNEVEFLAILRVVVIAEALSQDVEIETMKMKWMVFKP